MEVYMPEGNGLDPNEHPKKDSPEKYSEKKMEMEYKIIKLKEICDLGKKAMPYLTIIFVVVFVAIASKEALPYALAYLLYLFRLINKESTPKS
jgi:hypothetical protein